MPNVGKIVKGVAKAVTKKKVKASVSTAAKKIAAKKDAAASARGLKAANKGSMAPKGYKTDAARRAATLRSKEINAKPYNKMETSEMYELGRLASTISSAAPKNVISRSGRKANVPSMKSKAAATIASARAKKAK